MPTGFEHLGFAATRAHAATATIGNIQAALAAESDPLVRDIYTTALQKRGAPSSRATERQHVGNGLEAPLRNAAVSRPLVPSSSAVPGGRSLIQSSGEKDMGLFSFLGRVASDAIGIGEGITGIDVPFVGPGDRFMSGRPEARAAPAMSMVPGGATSLTVSGLASPCEPGFVFRNGRCEEAGIGGAIRRTLPGGGTGVQTTMRGSVVHGMGWLPEEVPVSRARCGRGAVLGRDGRCYGKRDIRNSDRMWPKPRAPLLTGGDLNCIAKASRAANRLTRQTKRLKKMGMMK